MSAPTGDTNRKCIAEGHWTTVFDDETGMVEHFHDPDEGPCEFAPTGDTDPLGEPSALAELGTRLDRLAELDTIAHTQWGEVSHQLAEVSACLDALGTRLDTIESSQLNTAAMLAGIAPRIGEAVAIVGDLARLGIRKTRIKYRAV